MRSPYWFLTIPCVLKNGKTTAFNDEQIVKGWFLKHAEAGRFRYAKFAREVGETSDYEHIQAYVVFETQVTFERVKALFPKETHIEPRRGTHSEACDYIGNEAKSGSVKWCFDVGSDEEVPEKSGVRFDVQKTDSRLRDIQQKILQGVSESELWADPDLFPTLVKYHRGIREFYGLNRKFTGGQKGGSYGIRN